MIIFIEALLLLLPRCFEFQTAHSSSQGASVGTAALLLPAVVRFFSKSLPHLLPRQAFSFCAYAGEISKLKRRHGLGFSLQTFHVAVNTVRPL